MKSIAFHIEKGGTAKPTLHVVFAYSSGVLMIGSSSSGVSMKCS